MITPNYYTAQYYTEQDIPFITINFVMSAGKALIYNDCKHSNFYVVESDWYLKVIREISYRGSYSS